MTWQEVLAKAQEEFRGRYKQEFVPSNGSSESKQYLFDYHEKLGEVSEALKPVGQRRARIHVTWPGHGKSEFVLEGTIYPNNLATQNVPEAYLRDLTEVMHEDLINMNLSPSFPMNILTERHKLYSSTSKPLSLCIRFTYDTRPDEKGLLDSADFLRAYSDIAYVFEAGTKDLAKNLRFTTLSALQNAKRSRSL